MSDASKRHVDDDRLLAYVTGRLEPEAAGLVDRHVAGCADCRRRRDEVEAVCAHLPAFEVEPSAGFDARLRARLDAVDEAAEPWWRRGFAWALLPAAATAACVALLVVGSPTSEPPAVLEVTAEPELLADLELLEELDAVELVDVIDDLDAIRALPEEEG
jgi:anti-sigma factor RsiW